MRGETITGRDLVTQFHPRCELFGRALARLELPRWNPDGFHGCSWLGPRAGGALHPAHLLFPVAGTPLGLALFVALHLALALEGARRLALRDGASARGAAASGVAFALGGFVVSQYWALPYLASAAALPWAALGGGLLGERGAAARRGAALLAAAVGLTLLAGEPQGALGLAAVAGIAAALAAPGAAARGEGGSAAGGPREGDAGPGDAVTARGLLREAARRPRALATGVGAAALATLLGLAAGAPQVLSIADEAGETDRGASGWRDARWGLAPTAMALDLVARGALGGEVADRGAYWGGAQWDGELPWCALGVGAVGLAGALVAARGGPRAPRLARARLEALLAIALGLLLAAGPITRALGLRFESKWLVLVALGLARLVGPGLDAALRSEAARRVAVRALAALAAALALALALALLPPGTIGALDGALGGAAHPADARAALATALARAALCAAAAAGVLVATGRGRLAPGSAGALLLGLLALELLHAGKPAIWTTGLPVHAPPPLALHLRARALQLDGVAGVASAGLGPPVRLASAPPLRRSLWLARARAPLEPGLDVLERLDAFDRLTLQPNVGLLFGVSAVEAFESSAPRELALLAADPDYQRLALPDRCALIGARWVLEDEALLGAAVRARLEVGPAITPGLRLARVLDCPPWAHLVVEAERAADLPDAARRLVAAPARLGRRVVLGPEGLPDGDLAVGLAVGGDPGHVALVRREAERVELVTRGERAAWLVLREAWSRHWRATVDGAPAVVARADLFDRAVRLGPGEHRVVFVYDPSWWRPSLLLLLIGWGGIALLALRCRPVAL